MISKANVFELTGKKALVTGAAEGIGFAIARLLVRQGCEVIVHDKDDAARCEKACEELRKDSGTAARYVLADFERSECLEELIVGVGSVDILVLNASMQLRKDIFSITRSDFDRHINTNFWSTFRLIQHFLPGMITNNWGRIITLGSVQEIKPHSMMPVYASIKSAIANLVKNLAKQHSKDGITVNNIAPGVIETDRNMEALSDAAYRNEVLGKIPAKILGQPEDCAGIALLLCSDAGRYITGQTISCDGGMSIL